MNLTCPARVCVCESLCRCCGGERVDVYGVLHSCATNRVSTTREGWQVARQTAFLRQTCGVEGGGVLL